MTFVLGINAYHGDSSAALLRDGRLVAAAEEERFNRVKHWAGFPKRAIAYCMEEGGIGLDGVDYLAINSDPRANLGRKIAYSLRRRPDLRLLLDRLWAAGKRWDIGDVLQSAFPDDRFLGRVEHVEHHLSHLASAYLVSPFDEAVAVSVDGFGDFASAAWGVGLGERVSVDDRVYFPHSLGIFYQAMTQYLGFPHYGDEYKVMGLAPYGKPRFMDEMRRMVLLKGDGTFELSLRYFRHHREKITYEWRGCAPAVGDLFTLALEDLLGPRRREDEALTQHHKDIARSVQGMYEEAFFTLLNRLYGAYGLDNLALAGGCAMNSVANGKIRRMTPFRNVYIQSAAGDAGGAIGAAMVVRAQVTREGMERANDDKRGNPRHGRLAEEEGLAGGRRFVMDHAFWGPQFKASQVEAVLDGQRKALEAQGCSLATVTDEDALCRETASAVAAGKVVGWFQGRMEWGPRALGNRSILCDPRRADMKDILNLKIKRRESFRPFAPSILREAVADWFEDDDDVPFMMKVFEIREYRRPAIPAVTHVDGSGRLQTVYRETNPRYYRLIEAFRDITGVPIVLNTSFNENEPVVCRPEEALDCFLRTKMDVLVIGDCFVQRG